MNILMVTNTYAPTVGGLEKSIEMTTAECRRRGHRTVVLAPEYEGRPPQETDVVRLSSIEDISQDEYSLRIAVPGMIASALKGFRPDVVHSHHPYIMGGTAFRLAAQMDVPLVFTYHTMYEEYLARYGLAAEVVKRFIVEYPLMYANMCDHVIVPSESILEELLARGLETPYTVIPTGVRLADFSKQPETDFRLREGIPPDAYVIGHLGRISPEKNVHALAREAARFMQDNGDAHMLLAGDGSEVGAVRSIFQKFGVDRRYHYAGVLHGENLRAAYHAMNVFIFSSLSETQGIVLAEAMAAGLPVIAVDAPGVRDIVEDGFNGRLISEAGEMRFALWWHITLDDEEKRRLAENARKTAEGYSIESTTDAILGIYDSLIEENGVTLKRRDSDWPRMVQRYLKGEFALFGGFTSSLARSVLGSDRNRRRKN